MLKKFITAMLVAALVISGVSWNGGKAYAVRSETTNSDGIEKVATVGQSTDIRTIYIKTDGTTITKEQKVAAEITVVDKTGGDLYEDDTVYETINDTGTIKVRGNSTSAADKKPYNISFSSKHNLFGMGKAKKWSLLANAFDKSLIRNRLAMELALDMGLQYTSQSTYVDLYINDEYYGNYLLIESVEEGEDRVDIDSAGGKDVLLEKEYDRDEEGQSYLRTARYGIRFNIGEPEGLDSETEQYKETAILLNRFETLLDDGDFEELSNFVDLNSFANFYIVNELFKNVDFNYSSTRFYIKDGIFYAGPLWDLDLSSGNANPSFYTTYYENGVSYKGLWCQQFQWFKKLMEIPEFNNMVVKRYKEVSPLISNMIYGDTGNSINAITTAYAQSFARNYAAKSSGGAGWSVQNKDSADNISYAPMGQWKTYSETVEFLRQWLVNRNNYLVEQFSKEKEPIKKTKITVTVNESDDDIILDGNADGSQSMIGSYFWNEEYKWLGYANFKGKASGDYKYLVMNYTGDISALRLEFVGDAGKSTEKSSKIYWFHNVNFDRYLVSADERAIGLLGNHLTIVIDLEKSGISLNEYNSGVHMHVATKNLPKGALEIYDARLVKSVTIEKTEKEQTTTKPVETTKPVQTTTVTKVQQSAKKPKPTKIKSIKKAKKSLKIKWRKVSGVKGYQIQYSVSKKFKKSKKATVKNGRITSKTIKKLKAKKKYYVRVRTYSVTKGKKYYSKWSKVKSCKTK